MKTKKGSIFKKYKVLELFRIREPSICFYFKVLYLKIELTFSNQKIAFFLKIEFRIFHFLLHWSIFRIPIKSSYLRRSKNSNFLYIDQLIKWINIFIYLFILSFKKHIKTKSSYQGKARQGIMKPTRWQETQTRFIQRITNRCRRSV